MLIRLRIALPIVGLLSLVAAFPACSARAFVGTEQVEAADENESAPIDEVEADGPGDVGAEPERVEPNVDGDNDASDDDASDDDASDDDVEI